MIPRAITTVNVSEAKLENEVLTLSGSLSSGAEFFYSNSQRLYKVSDQDNHYGMGRTLEEAITGMMNDRRTGFIPFKEWHGNELKDVGPGFMPEYMRKPLE